MKAFTLKKLVQEPLIHFLAIGAGLFLVFGLIREPAPEAPNRIVVDTGQVAQLNAQFNRTWMRPPTDAELAGLIENHVRDEVYYREALAMGLDRNDPNVRRQMRLKLEYLLEDLSAVETHGKEALTAYLKAHPEKFQEPPQISFRQIYLNPDRHLDMRTDAANMLARLKAGEASDTVGEPTLMNAAYVKATPEDITRQFGEAFTREVFALPPDGWTGPLYSTLGGHLVQINARVGSRLPALYEIRAKVEREYVVQRSEKLKESAYRQMRANYEVIVQPAQAVAKKAKVVVATNQHQGTVQ